MVMTVAGQPLRLLHLEDSLADHVLAKLTLQRAKLHCNVQQVDTLQDFCDLTSNQPFDLILADYRLQGFTALDAWEHVAKLATPVPFVLLSGAIGEAAAVDAMRLGFSDYLLKDDISRLPHVVTRAIEVHQARLKLIGHQRILQRALQTIQLRRAKITHAKVLHLAGFF